MGPLVLHVLGVLLNLLLVTHSPQKVSRRHLCLVLMGPVRHTSEVDRRSGAIATRHGVGHVDAAFIVGGILVATLGGVDSLR